MEQKDIEKILSTGIPDIAQVYGGIRGRTMSSRRQGFAWPVIQEVGIRTVIDLRKDGIQSSLIEKCKGCGINYFYYPVDNRCNNIETMVKLFPELCRLIDEGDFYIACALGLHRTDIALCTYWVFHAADKGFDPPAIRGYHQSGGHNTSKIMRVLNGFYKYITEHEGKEPIPMEVFKQRKDIIKRLSKE